MRRRTVGADVGPTAAVLGREVGLVLGEAGEGFGLGEEAGDAVLDRAGEAGPGLEGGLEEDGPGRAGPDGRFARGEALEAKDDCALM